MTTPDLKLGSRGPAVAAAQRALGIPADGVFGPQTDQAVRAFQAARGLEVDGVIGPITRGALGNGVGGMQSGETVTMALQRILGVAADGEYGPITRAAVRALPAGARAARRRGRRAADARRARAADRRHARRGRAVCGRVHRRCSAMRSQIGKPYAWGGNGPS